MPAPAPLRQSLSHLPCKQEQYSQSATTDGRKCTQTETDASEVGRNLTQPGMEAGCEPLAEDFSAAGTCRAASRRGVADRDLPAQLLVRVALVVQRVRHGPAHGQEHQSLVSAR